MVLGGVVAGLPVRLIVAWRLWRRVCATQSTTMALGGAAGLAGMTLFNLAINVDTTRELVKFITCGRTQVPRT